MRIPKPGSLNTLFSLLLASVPLQAEELMKQTTAWDGGAIQYPSGQAQITAFRLVIEENQITPFHCHPVPTMGYVLKGTIEVETSGGKKTTFTEGDSAIEVMRTLHRGNAIGGPVEIIVFYAGSTDMPTTVLPQNDPEGRYCQE